MGYDIKFSWRTAGWQSFRGEIFRPLKLKKSPPLPCFLRGKGVGNIASDLTVKPSSLSCRSQTLFHTRNVFYEEKNVHPGPPRWVQPKEPGKNGIIIGVIYAQICRSDRVLDKKVTITEVCLPPMWLYTELGIFPSYSKQVVRHNLQRVRDVLTCEHDKSSE